MPAREKTRPRTRGTTDDEFVVFLQGIPAHCRWQELKDLVRQTALHIRQAVVYDDHHGFPTGLGQIIVKNEEEAWRTYHRLSSTGWEGRSLVVTLSKTCAPTHPIAGPTKSPACFFPSSASESSSSSSAPASASPGYTPVSGYTTPPSLPQQLGMPSPEPYIPTPEYTPIINLPPFIPMYPDHLDPIYTFYPTPTGTATATATTTGTGTYPQPYPSPSTPTPTPTPTTYRPKPPSPNKGPIRTILIHNLSPTITKHDLCTVFHEAGPIETSQVDNTDARMSTTARITYATADAAKRAVALFNSASLGPDLPLSPGSKRLRVRLDRECLVAYAPGSGSGFGSGSGSGLSSSPNLSSGSGADTSVGTTTCPVRPRDCQPLVVNGSGVGKSTVIA